MKCEKCGNDHDGSFGSGRFCSKSCANSRVRTDEIKRKISEGVKNSEKFQKGWAKEISVRRGKMIRIEKICPVCNKPFTLKKHQEGKIYCSRKCYNKDSALKYRKKTPGGYRKGSGRSHGGYYKGIWCHSTYELVFLIYCLDHNIQIDRCKQTFEYVSSDGNQRIYYPDFLVDGTITEIKGFHSPNVDLKAQSVVNEGLDYQIFYKNDLKSHFNYVNTNYSSDYFTLYDETKRFEKECEICGKPIISDKPIPKTKGCCRSHTVMLVRKHKKWKSGISSVW